MFKDVFFTMSRQMWGSGETCILILQGTRSYVTQLQTIHIEQLIQWHCNSISSAEVNVRNFKLVHYEKNAIKVSLYEIQLCICTYYSKFSKWINTLVLFLLPKKKKILCYLKKKSTHALVCINVSLLYSNKWNVSATRDHLQGGNNKNMAIITMCQNRSMYKKFIQYSLKSQWKEYQMDGYKMSEDERLLYMDYSAVDDVHRRYM